MDWHFDAVSHTSLVVQGSLVEQTPNETNFVTVGALVTKPNTQIHRTKIGSQGAIIVTTQTLEIEISSYRWSDSSAKRGLLSVLYGNEMDLYPETSEIPTQRKIHPIIKKAERHLRANPGLSLNALARLLGTNPSYLSQLYKSMTGSSLNHKRTNNRLALAANAIAEGTTIGSAAIIANFSDQAHLTRQFQKFYGLSPRQYQKAIQRIS